MSNRKAFEQWAQFDLMAHDFERGEHGEYLDDFLQQSWLGWQARAQGGEAVAAVNKASTGEYEFYPASGLVDMPNGIHRLYATHHPADNWIPCSERLPTDADADCDLCAWICWTDEDGEWRVDRETVADIDCGYFAWMHSSLIEPAPPTQEGE